MFDEEKKIYINRSKNVGGFEFGIAMVISGAIFTVIGALNLQSASFLLGSGVGCLFIGGLSMVTSKLIKPKWIMNKSRWGIFSNKDLTPKDLEEYRKEKEFNKECSLEVESPRGETKKSTKIYEKYLETFNNISEKHQNIVKNMQNNVFIMQLITANLITIEDTKILEPVNIQKIRDELQKCVEALKKSINNIDNIYNKYNLMDKLCEDLGDLYNYLKGYNEKGVQDKKINLTLKSLKITKQSDLKINKHNNPEKPNKSKKPNKFNKQNKSKRPDKPKQPKELKETIIKEQPRWDNYTQIENLNDLNILSTQKLPPNFFGIQAIIKYE